MKKELVCELKSLRFLNTQNGMNAYISLDKIAIPKSVKVFIKNTDTPIFINSFTKFGDPIFSTNELLLLSLKYSGNLSKIEFLIFYEEEIFEIAQENFDTISGIEKTLTNLDDLNMLIDFRQKFVRVNNNTEKQLTDFVIFGKYLLTKDGLICIIEKKKGLLYFTRNNVETFDDFKDLNKSFRITTSNYHFPSSKYICPICGKCLSISDIKHTQVKIVNDVFYHYTCYHNHMDISEIKALIACIKDLTNDLSLDFDYELISSNEIFSIIFNISNTPISIKKTSSNYFIIHLNKHLSIKQLFKFKRQINCIINLKDSRNINVNTIDDIIHILELLFTT